VELLDRLVEQMFADRWITDLRQAVQLPLGLVEDPRLQVRQGPFTELARATDVAEFLIAHGLCRQAHGDPAAFVEDVQTGLGLVRHLAHHASLVPFEDASNLEWWFVRAIQEWLKELRGRPELLRRLLAELQQHQRTVPYDVDQLRAAQHLLALNTLEDVDGILSSLRVRRRVPRDLLFSTVRLAWQVPWERERNLRLLDCIRTGKPEAAYLFQALPWREQIAGMENDEHFRLLRHGSGGWFGLSQVAVALRCYEAEKGAFPQDLEALVPEYLPELPRASPDDPRPMAYHRPAPPGVGEGRKVSGELLAAQILVWYSQDRGPQVRGAVKGPVLPVRGEARYVVPPPAPPRRSPEEAQRK
jgi:hypothetical protein